MALTENSMLTPECIILAEETLQLEENHLAGIVPEIICIFIQFRPGSLPPRELISEIVPQRLYPARELFTDFLRTASWPAQASTVEWN